MKYFIALILIVGAGYFYWDANKSNIESEGFFTGWYLDYAGYEEAMAEAEKDDSLLLVYFYADW